jgi:hypothetical protein
MDRRALFFLGAAVVSFVLVPVTEPAQRWVPVALAVVYLLLSVASWLDRRGRASGGPGGQTQIIERPRSPGAET